MLKLPDPAFTQNIRLHLKFRIMVYAAACLTAWSCASLADAHTLAGNWFKEPDSWVYQGQIDLADAGLEPIDKIYLTGGRFWQQADFEVNTSDHYVLDFKNTSVIGYFRHIILNASGYPLVDVRGGIQSSETNPFFLRHGREADLPAGRYRLLTELDSPVFVAYPQPYLDTLEHYRQAIKQCNALTLLCMGVLLSLIVYYMAQALAGRRLSDAMYSLFILCAFVFGSSTLLVFSELFGMRSMFPVRTPILFASCAYVLFVMALLKIRADNYPRLRMAGEAVLALLCVMVIVGLALPNWDIEITRYALVLFSFYGMCNGLMNPDTSKGRIYTVSRGEHEDKRDKIQAPQIQSGIQAGCRQAGS
ncbi:hypothetical protein F6R98_13870 [Candidatus Methylospira mobilis]|uniref:7TM-DISM receptor extracellular domain-containing protein n=1 Tax=Candidatus Methylospira mobilis TaxID=1808979 RepID=A0A5Q0BMY0_9GAMM|nr:hypothetical protein [Candidatus Methylospira mobilis]QFY43574.1 hypothetical protein F6R98_13870 [Candidatus Methylospira mobilis]